MANQALKTGETKKQVSKSQPTRSTASMPQPSSQANRSNYGVPLKVVKSNAVNTNKMSTTKGTRSPDVSDPSVRTILVKDFASVHLSNHIVYSGVLIVISFVIYAITATVSLLSFRNTEIAQTIGYVISGFVLLFGHYQIGLKHDYKLSHGWLHALAEPLPKARLKLMRGMEFGRRAIVGVLVFVAVAFTAAFLVLTRM